MRRDAALIAGTLSAAGVLWALAGPWWGGLLVVSVLLLRRRGGRPAGVPKRRRRVWSDEERRFILERDGWACVQCRSQSELEIDHVIPFSRGGACSVDNAQVLCGPCNRRKGAS